jgi:L-asparagine transporter-like permease
MVSAAGLGLALLTSLIAPGSAFVYLLGVSLFGGLYAWLIIFVTHLFFRRRRRRALFPSFVGALFIAAILLTTWWVEGMRITMIAGLSWLALLSVLYWFIERRRVAVPLAAPGKLI